MSPNSQRIEPKGPTFLSCPFCGKNPDPTDPSTLHPTGTVWRDDADIGFRTYHGHQERREGDGRCWVFNCLGESGGCGAEVHGDSEDQAVAAWNRRPQSAGPEDGFRAALLRAKEIILMMSASKAVRNLDEDIVWFNRLLSAPSEAGKDEGK